MTHTKRSTQKVEVVRLAVSSNPKQKGTKSYRRFAKYADRMPVATALAKGITRADLRWDLAHGFIKVVRAAA